MNPMVQPAGTAQPLVNRYFPDKNKPRGLRFTFPFLDQAITQFEYQLQLQPAAMEWISGVFIDNSANQQQFQLLIGETGQRVTVPGYSQAVFELFGLLTDKVTIVGVTTGNVNVVATFTNYVPDSANSIWSVLDPGTVIGTITVNGTVTALPTTGAPIDRSATIAAAGTPQSIAAANPNRRMLHIFNPMANAALPNAGVLTVGFGAGENYGDPGGYDITPGGSFTFDGSAIPSSQIFISSTDAGAVVSAMEI
jgi:hypothetical protein